MLKFKKILLPLFIAFVGSSLNAQKYVDGYYISLKGDTIKGAALLNAYSKMSKEIRFKSQNGEDLVLKPEAVKAVWLSPDRFFESHAIHFKNLLDELNGTYFLRYLAKTDSIALMKFDCNQYVGLYIQKKGEKITPLQMVNDFVSKQEGDFRKQTITASDTISYADQINTYGNVGQFKSRKTYLFLLYQYFNYCDATIMNSSYRLTENDMKKAFYQLSKCTGQQNQIKKYFKQTAWKPSVGITLGRQLTSKNFNYESPIGLGIFFNYSDLRDGVGVGINWLKAVPKKTALSPSNGAFIEYSIYYNRKLFVREKYNFGALLGVAILKNQGLSIQSNFQGTPINVTVVPGEQHRYTILGVSYSYQFSNKNYLTAQFIGNIFNIGSDATIFSRVQLQYEHRF